VRAAALFWQCESVEAAPAYRRNSAAPPEAAVQIALPVLAGRHKHFANMDGFGRLRRLVDGVALLHADWRAALIGSYSSIIRVAPLLHGL
jgi:hypothetical protein